MQHVLIQRWIGGGEGVGARTLSFLYLRVQNFITWIEVFQKKKSGHLNKTKDQKLTVFKLQFNAMWSPSKANKHNYMQLSMGLLIFGGSGDMEELIIPNNNMLFMLPSYQRNTVCM